LGVGPIIPTLTGTALNGLPPRKSQEQEPQVPALLLSWGLGGESQGSTGALVSKPLAPPG
jgi:hypothetical protein